MTKRIMTTDITAPAAQALLEQRFPGETRLVPIRDEELVVRGYELKVGNRTLVFVGATIAQVMVELFGDGISYDRRKAQLRKARRASKPNWDAQRDYDERWGTDNGGLVDHHGRNR